MSKKLIALFVLAAFLSFNVSCSSIVKKSPAEISSRSTNPVILNVVLRSGENLAFERDKPARLSAEGDSIVGTTLENVEIERTQISKLVSDKKGRITLIETLDGQVIIPERAYALKDTVRAEVYRPVTIPLSDVHQLWVGRANVGLSVVAGLAAGAVTVLLGYFLIKGVFIDPTAESLDQLDSCPFVYSFDGAEYVLDAEPYGAAVSEGLKRTDWVELPHLRAAGGKYRVLLTNELDETQYTDELKVVAVDHAPGVDVAPGLDGRIHTFARPLAPTRANEVNGRDILAFVCADDRVFWIGDLDGREPDESGDFRDELVFEFPKPAGAVRAKLLANVWTTAWASISAGKFLELYGTSLEEAYRDVDRGGPLYHLFQSWMEREELYRLKIWVETPGGWKERGAIWGGAPVITQEKAYLIDVSDVAGETLRIKLRPPVNFWMVNSLAVDYGEDLPVHVAELAAESAIDAGGRDVRAELEATDGIYHVSPDRGERTELEFAAPPVPEGLERTMLVKASGYYKAHIDAAGSPRTALIARVLGEPGFAARYSFRKYREWETALAHSALAAVYK